MGIIYSLLGWTSSEEEPDPITGLTPTEVGLIKTSWANSSKDRTNLGANIMLMLFEKHPEYKNFFPFRDVPEDQLRDNIKFKVHCTTVVYSLGQIIDNLQNTDLILAMLDKLAENHIRHGAPPEGFLDIQEPILSALQPLSAEETKAWDMLLHTALSFISMKIREGQSKSG